MSGKQMHLGLFLQGTGSHVAGWRYPGAMNSNQDFGSLREIAAIAERGKFDMLFVADTLSSKPAAHPSFVARLEPLTMLAALSVTTKFIGLAGTVSTTYSDPYSVARAFASLDHISGGRAAWNVVTTSDQAAAANFGSQHPVHDERYEIAEEFVDVARGLWDCWADDAIVADRASGIYINADRLRPLNHKGRYFSVAGPMNIGRCPQGHPVIVQAGGSPPGKRLAARTADIVFTVTQDIEDAKSEYAAWKSLALEFGRSPSAIKIMPGVMPVVGSTAEEARARLALYQSYVDESNGLDMLSRRLGIDLSQYSLDGPIPDVPPTDGGQAFARVLLDKAKRENMSLRDLYNLTAASRGHWVLCGTPMTIAETLEQWFREGAADGFNVMPAQFPEDMGRFVEEVVPILQQRGLFRRDYAGRTLREHLGLIRPTN